MTISAPANISAASEKLSERNFLPHTRVLEETRETAKPPTKNPTFPPTSRPSTDVPTDLPTVSPTSSAPVFTPTIAPITAMPVDGDYELFEKLGMTLRGVSYAKFGVSDRVMLEATLGNHIKDYYKTNQNSKHVFNVIVGTEILSAFSADDVINSGSRSMQARDNGSSSNYLATTIIYKQQVRFDTGDGLTEPKDIVTEPFQSNDLGGMQSEFINFLNKNIDTLASLRSIDDVNLNPITPIEYNDEVKDLRMHLADMSTILDSRGKRMWTNAMNQHVRTFYEKKVVEGEFDVFELECHSSVVSQKLVSSILTITYTLELFYRSFADPIPDEQVVVAQPFELKEDQDTFIDTLTMVRDTDFENAIEIRDQPGDDNVIIPSLFPTTPSVTLFNDDIGVVSENTVLSEPNVRTQVLSVGLILSGFLILVSMFACEVAGCRKRRMTKTIQDERNNGRQQRRRLSSLSLPHINHTNPYMSNESNRQHEIETTCETNSTNSCNNRSNLSLLVSSFPSPQTSARSVFNDGNDNTRSLPSHQTSARSVFNDGYDTTGPKLSDFDLSMENESTASAELYGQDHSTKLFGQEVELAGLVAAPQNVHSIFQNDSNTVDPSFSVFLNEQSAELYGQDRSTKLFGQEVELAGSVAVDTVDPSFSNDASSPSPSTNLMSFNGDDDEDETHLSPPLMFDTTNNDTQQYGDEHHQSPLFASKEPEEFVMFDTTNNDTQQYCDGHHQSPLFASKEPEEFGRPLLKNLEQEPPQNVHSIFQNDSNTVDPSFSVFLNEQSAELYGQDRSTKLFGQEVELAGSVAVDTVDSSSSNVASLPSPSTNLMSFNGDDDEDETHLSPPLMFDTTNNDRQQYGDDHHQSPLSASKEPEEFGLRGLPLLKLSSSGCEGSRSKMRLEEEPPQNVRSIFHTDSDTMDPSFSNVARSASPQTDLMNFNGGDDDNESHLSPLPIVGATSNDRHHHGDEYHQPPLFTSKEPEKFGRRLLKSSSSGRKDTSRKERLQEEPPETVPSLFHDDWSPPTANPDAPVIITTWKSVPEVRSNFEMLLSSMFSRKGGGDKDNDDHLKV
eukprot:CAMPEP_0194395748 /NCGR_PEP_ID=MMETSP0174-20130528/124596_1 /TAXON_ID=216777 /ORGANISM="Proboscia alata, Strain PI-D3" /LENGTH=1068 /DNA_ID=CAMNT_0039191719 /DNA_START=213 /DNA_END=3420 /DNA_ORIENTATION=-